MDRGANFYFLLIVRFRFRIPLTHIFRNLTFFRFLKSLFYFFFTCVVNIASNIYNVVN